jgi:hypothetical protein
LKVDNVNNDKGDCIFLDARLQNMEEDDFPHDSIH